MESRLVFSKTPGSWLKYKARTLLSNRTYIAPLLIWLLAAIGLTANAHSLFGATPHMEVIVLAILLFLFGICNVIMATWLERFRIRYDREVSSASVIHEIVEVIRDYHTQRHIRRSLNYLAATSPQQTTLECVRKVCQVLLDKYIQPRHRGNISWTVKYVNKGSLLSIRDDGSAKYRNQEPEPIANCPVYIALTQRNHIPYLYVGDVQSYTSEELRLLGPDSQAIRQRAENQGYRTFLALPINTGNINPGQTPLSKLSLGFVGFDSAEPIGFGDIAEEELYFLAAVIDALSEPVYDLICDVGGKEDLKTPEKKN